MAEPKTYRLERIVDILQVPADRRPDCMKELLYGLSLAELTGAQLLGPMHWTDDGDLSSTLKDPDGAELKLEVTRG